MLNCRKNGNYGTVRAHLCEVRLAICIAARCMIINAFVSLYTVSLTPLFFHSMAYYSRTREWSVINTLVSGKFAWKFRSHRFLLFLSARLQLLFHWRTWAK